MGKYKIDDIKIGNHVSFKRNGIDDFGMYWTVIGFLNGMVQVKIKEMGNDDELYIDVDDIESLQNVNDTRYQ
ncbi:hypothetical protein FF125_06935 [Aureibaculum algae]|uniref:Uncharacterized protein n=1 Tax=Aureibaculum algae TaxID=2584122 RepID=A0A5B7TT78_9FLAO|nr:hypothetical protein [Aureibaculum algae]QCX38177.1 hypothetical protein FF125_06935 [Aureibaculum algae]